jgi:hypothetical protein
MIITIKGEDFERYHTPYRTALAVVTASLPESGGGKCKK